MAGLQFWASNAQGGFFTNNRLSQQLRHGLVPLMKFRQFVDIKEGWGKGVGDTLFYNKISKVDTAGGALVETNVMPENQYSIARGTIVLTEYGNSIPFTGKLEALSEFNVMDPTMKVLRNDMAEVLDKRAGLEFKRSQRKYICLTTLTGTLTSLADSTTATFASAGIARSSPKAFHFKEVIDELKKRNIPKFDGENYVCIGSVAALRKLKDDTEWLDAAKYGDPERLFNGEVGRFYGCRFIEETNLLVNTLGSAAGSFPKLGEAVVFGAEAVIEGIAVPEEIRAKVTTDYGRSQGLAWYAILGYKKMFKAADSGQDEHIIHITSAH